MANELLALRGRQIGGGARLHSESQYTLVRSGRAETAEITLPGCSGLVAPISDCNQTMDLIFRILPTIALEMKFFGAWS